MQGFGTEPPRAAWNVSSPTASLAFQPGPLVHGLLACSLSISPPGMLLEHPPTLGCSLHIPRSGMLHPSGAQLE